MRDLMSNIHPVSAIPLGPAVTDNSPFVGMVVDRRGFGSLVFVIHAGTLTTAGATFTPLVEHGDAADLSDAAAVPDDLLSGSEAMAGFTGANDGVVRKVGYVGGKRYVRLTVTPSGNGAAASLSAMAVLGHPVNAPTPNPPA